MSRWPDNEGGETLLDLPLDPLHVVSESDTLADVAAGFIRNGLSCAVLREAPLRVVTERDMVGAWGKGAGPHDQVTTVATIRPYWVPASMSVTDAAGLMVGLGVRHLVVLDQAGFPTGVVSMAELLVSLLRAPSSSTVYARFSEVLLGSGYVRTTK